MLFVSHSRFTPDKSWLMDPQRTCRARSGRRFRGATLLGTCHLECPNNVALISETPANPAMSDHSTRRDPRSLEGDFEGDVVGRFLPHLEMPQQRRPGYLTRGARHTRRPGKATATATLGTRHFDSDLRRLRRKNLSDGQARHSRRGHQEPQRAPVGFGDEDHGLAAVGEGLQHPGGLVVPG